jgi:putative transposase
LRCAKILVVEACYHRRMLRRQAFQFALMPNGSQLRMLRRFAGACRFVFNRALALQEQQHEDGGKFIRYEAMASHLVAWKKDPHTGARAVLTS